MPGSDFFLEETTTNRFTPQLGKAKLEPFKVATADFPLYKKGFFSANKSYRN